MNVLSLATYRSSFYRQQEVGLRNAGVAVETISATELSSYDTSVIEYIPKIDRHSPVNYAIQGIKFYPKILMSSFSGYDLIHANSGLTAPFALSQPIRPVVLTLWGSDLMGDRLYGQLSKLTRFCSRRADAVIVMSEEMAEAVPVDAYVIPTGVNFQLFRPRDKKTAKEHVQWDDEAHDVLWPYPKDRAVKNYPLADRVIERVSERKSTDVKLRTINGVDHSEMPTYYNAADLLLMTSDREGSPNTVKEAMACNLPVVSTDVGDVCHQLDQVQPSTVCTSEDELVEAVVEILETDCRSNARDASAEISQEAVSRQIKEVYRNVL